MQSTAQEAARPPVEFNPFGPGLDEDPYPTFARLRETPVCYWEEGRSWLVTRQSEILSVLKDSRFTTDRAAWELAAMAQATSSPELEELDRHGLFSLSNADHARVRKLVSPSFTPRAVERLRPAIQAIVDETLAAAAGKEVFDVVHDFAERIPVRVISRMLHIPQDRDAAFHRFADAVVKQFFAMMMGPEERARLLESIHEGLGMVGEVIDERRKAPIEGDILTSLIQAEEQGDRLSRLELISLVMGLLVGGSETTLHLIGFVTWNLLRRPEVLADVQREPQLWAPLMDEVLRFDNFGKMGILRYATEDVELAGQHIRKGQMLILMLNAAMRDSSVYPDADRLDPRRDTTGSLAFGNGAHYCLGANLARLEGQIAVGTLFRRFPAMTMLEPPTFAPHPGIRNMSSFKVRLGAPAA